MVREVGISAGLEEMANTNNVALLNRLVCFAEIHR